jgi:FAD/FMN-containing dehydrogenase
MIAAVLAAIILYVCVRRTVDLALPPTGEKKCDFVFPPRMDEAKPTEISVEGTSLLSFSLRNGFVNDASCLNKTAVAGVVTVSSENDVREALAYARDHGLKISAAGAQHSMGGQSFDAGQLVLNMRGLSKVTLDEQRGVLTAEAGATWAQIQQFLDERGLAVKAMQSINIFTVGGTVSVNAHGIAHRPGPVASTIKSMRIMRADGSVVVATPSENAELFAHVIGGYGLFGVVLDVDLEVVENELYAWRTDYINYQNFPEFYTANVANNDDVDLFYARLSVSPSSYLSEVAVHTYTTVDSGEPQPLQAESYTWLNRLVFNLSKTGSVGRWFRWTLEKHLEPRLHTCSRNQALGSPEACLVSRNQEMYDSMEYLKTRLEDTNILQEYFIEPDQVPTFVDGLREIVKKRGVNLINVTVRGVEEDTVSALPYAKGDRVGLVLYFNQGLNTEDSEIIRQTTEDLVALALDLHGTFYLPYQLYYTKDQLKKSYPEIDGFFEMKKRYDPEELFSNTWYRSYGA